MLRLEYLGELNFQQVDYPSQSKTHLNGCQYIARDPVNFSSTESIFVHITGQVAWFSKGNFQFGKNCAKQHCCPYIWMMRFSTDLYYCIKVYRFVLWQKNKIIHHTILQLCHRNQFKFHWKGCKIDLLPHKINLSQNVNSATSLPQTKKWFVNYSYKIEFNLGRQKNSGNSCHMADIRSTPNSITFWKILIRVLNY